MKKLLLTLLILFLLPAVLGATTIYEFNTETNVQALMCPSFDTGASPPASGPDPGCGVAETDATSQAGLDARGGTTYDQPDLGANDEDYIRFIFDVQETAANINSLNFTWQGLSEGTGLTIHFHLWNHTAAGWNADCDATTNAGTMVNRTCLVNGNFSHIINSTGHAVFLVQGVKGGGGALFISNDYIQLSVDYDAPPTVTSVSDDGPAYITELLNITANITDNEADNVAIIVCRTDSMTDGYPGNCSAGQHLCNATGYSSGGTAWCTYTTNSSDQGTLNYYVFGCEQGTSVCSCLGSRQSCCRFCRR